MKKNIPVLLLSLLIQTAVCLANTNPTILTCQNQHDFGTDLSVKVSSNEARMNYEISIPPNDPMLTGIRKFTLVIGAGEKIHPIELYAQLHTGSKTDGSKSTRFFIAHHLIEKAYVQISYQGDLSGFSSDSRIVYLKVSTFKETKTANQQVDPIVTTPVDKVEAQSTQGHP